MKTTINAIGILSLILLGSIMVNAQVVSKGVQQYANKKSIEAEKARKSELQVQSVQFPAIVVSKGVARSNEQVADGNMASNYPTWAVSKGVAQKNTTPGQERTRSKENPNKDISNDAPGITKR
jgi:hypothetical protein